MSQSSGPPNPKRRHKPKFKLESIHVDELLNAAGMSGFLGVLEPPKASAPHLEKLASEMLEELASSAAVPERYQAATEIQKTGIPESGTPVAGTPDKGVADTFLSAPLAETSSESGRIGTPGSGVPVLGVPDSGIPVPQTPISGIPDSDALPPPLVLRRRTIRQAVLVQDGHSLGEQRIYETLWDHAHPYGDQARIVTVGYRTLSHLSGLTVNNCKANIQALIQKLAIEEHRAHSSVQGTTYVVHNYNAILRRRRAAGLTHYIKTRGVQFVDPVTGSGLDLSGIPESGTPFPETGIPESGGSGIPVSDTPSIEISIRKADVQSPSSSEVAFLSRSTAELGAGVDDDLLVKLIKACRDQQPAATVEEIRDFIDWKWLQAGTEIKNPGGYLLTVVPKCFSGEFYRQHQAQKELTRKRSQEQGRIADQSAEATRAEMQRILDDPSAAEEDKSFARRILSHLNPPQT